MALVTGRQLISLRLQEMPALDQLFTTVENYPNMTMEYLYVVAELRDMGGRCMEKI